MLARVKVSSHFVAFLTYTQMKLLCPCEFGSASRGHSLGAFVLESIELQILSSSSLRASSAEAEFSRFRSASAAGR